MTSSVRNPNGSFKTCLILADIIEVTKSFLYMELEDYYCKKMRKIFFITYLQGCWNNMILIFTLVKSKKCKRKIKKSRFLFQNHDSIFKIKNMPISEYIYHFRCYKPNEKYMSHCWVVIEVFIIIIKQIVFFWYDCYRRWQGKETQLRSQVFYSGRHVTVINTPA